MDDANIKYLEAKISGLTSLINAQFINVHETLDDIKEQTKTINKEINSHQIDLVELKISDHDHLLNCPNIEKIEKINADLTEYRILKKYPKIALFLLAVGILLVIFNVFDIYNSIHFNNLKSNSNTVDYNYLIQLIDSLKPKV